MNDRHGPPDEEHREAEVIRLAPPAEKPPEKGAYDDEEDLDSGSRGWILRTVAIVLIIGLVALFVARPARRAEGPPDFELPLLDGSGTLSSDAIRGRPVVLNFWASWCLPCREEAPVLERAWQRYRDEGAVIVGVNVQDRPDDARRFVAEEGLTFPIVTDYDQELARELQVYGLPQTFFVDATWRFHGEYAGSAQGRQTPSGFPGAPRGTAILGAISEERLEQALREMLQEAPAGEDP